MDPVVAAERGLLNYGVLGIVCVLLIGALVWMTKRWSDVMQGRVDDRDKMTVAVTALTNEFKDSVRSMTVTIDAMKVTIDALKITIDGLKAATEAERTVLGELKSTIDSVMRDAVRDPRRTAKE